MSDPASPVIALPLTQFEAVFPFYFGLDHEDRVVQVGARLAKLLHADILGEPLSSRFTLVRPLAVSLTFSSLAQHTDQLFIFKHQTSDLHLRGQLIRLPEPSAAALIFLGSPWVNEIGTLRKLGLRISDFAVHDSAIDLLPALQLQSTALAEANDLAARLTEERARLRQATRDLKAKVEALEARNQEVHALNEELRRQIEQRSRRLLEGLVPREGPLPAAAPLSPGMLLGDHYRVIRVIDEGGMGLVYEVERTTDNRRLAAKVLTMGPDIAAIRRFAREAQILARLHHPNLISIADIDATSGGVLYIVMELVNGSSLRQLRPRFGELRFGLSVLRQIALALSELHAQGVIHRDLKPENVLVMQQAPDELPFVKLADFGISIFRDEARSIPAAPEHSPQEAADPGAGAAAGKAASGDARGAEEAAAALHGGDEGEDEASLGRANTEPEGRASAATAESARAELTRTDPADGAASGDDRLRTQTGVIIGTPLYMAPELARGSRDAQPASDVFSLGVVAYELLTGKMPFDQPPIVTRAIQREVGTSPLLDQCPGLPGPLAEIFERCLATEPSRRPTAQEIALLVTATLEAAP